MPNAKAKKPETFRYQKTLQSGRIFRFNEIRQPGTLCCRGQVAEEGDDDPSYCLVMLVAGSNKSISSQYIYWTDEEYKNAERPMPKGTENELKAAVLELTGWPGQPPRKNPPQPKKR